MTKRLVVAALAAAVLAAVPGPARAGKLYAVSAQYEPSNAALYRYEVTGPDDHRYEANPPGEVDEPGEVTIPDLLRCRRVSALDFRDPIVDGGLVFHYTPHTEPTGN